MVCGRIAVCARSCILFRAHALLVLSCWAIFMRVYAQIMGAVTFWLFISTSVIISASAAMWCVQLKLQLLFFVKMAAPLCKRVNPPPILPAGWLGGEDLNFSLAQELHVVSDFGREQRWRFFLHDVYVRHIYMYLTIYGLQGLVSLLDPLPGRSSRSPAPACHLPS